MNGKDSCNVNLTRKKERIGEGGKKPERRGGDSLESSTWKEDEDSPT